MQNIRYLIVLNYNWTELQNILPKLLVDFQGINLWKIAHNMEYNRAPVNIVLEAFAPWTDIAMLSHKYYVKCITRIDESDNVGNLYTVHYDYTNGVEDAINHCRAVLHSDCDCYSAD